MKLDTLFPFLKSVEKYDFIIIDDYFPLPAANTWRSVEFHEYFKRIPNTKCLNITADFSNDFMTGYPSTFYEEKLASYLTYKPENKKFISQIDIHKKYKAKLAYLLFFNNIALMLPWLEENKIPFVFCLFPGGGFYPDNEERNLSFKRIFSSPMFREVIVTQHFTQDYLIKNELCEKNKITFILGGVSQIDPTSVPSKKYYKQEKDTFDICFVSHKYFEKGIKKGFDLFLEVAMQCTEKYRDMHFHVIGNWDEEIKPYLTSPNIHFSSVKPAEYFPAFYAEMDIFLTPNRSFKLLQDFPAYKASTSLEFDGFPLGLDAGICGSALFMTDELNHTKGFFNDGENIVIIDHKVSHICDRITYYYTHLDELYLLSKKQSTKMKKLFDINSQINKRLAVFNKYLK